MLSDLSVRRPIFAAVAAIILCVIGLAAFAALPIRELPSVDPPVVSISTNYRGASAEVIEERITQVIERLVSGVQGIDRVNSSSRDGVSRINITFTLKTDLETAANDVRDTVSRVQAQLPEQADPPQIAKANADSSPIIILNMTSTTLNALELGDYADRYLVERLSTIPGVATVGLYGAPLYSMRIWLDADAMAARGLTVDDVETALSTQNVELPAGALESQTKDFTIRVNRGYSRPEDFAKLPIKAGTTGSSATSSAASGVNGATGVPTTGSVDSPGLSSPAYVARLGDIARIEEGPDERRKLFRGNGVEQIGLAMTRQSQANDLEIAKLVTKEVETVNKTLPAGTKLIIAVDSSKFTSQAIHEVWITMGIALALVALVNLVFLGSWRAAIIPSIVAPICLMSTFIVLAPMGFSLNLLTLLALVLSIGLVVDDAIVVVENIQRRVDEGEPPTVAAMRGTRPVFFAVVATTIVLISVFAPLMFLPGYIGRLFVELAVAIASAVAFSCLLALSLSPMMSSKLLRKEHGEGWVARRVDAGMARLRGSYRNSLDMLLGKRVASIGAGVLVVVLLGLAALLFNTVPHELVPNEDRGRVDISATGPEGSGYEYTLKAAMQVEKQMKKYYDQGEVERYLISVPRFGANQFNSGNGVLVMKDWGHRKMTSDEVAADLNKSLGSITGVRAVASVRGPFQRGGGQGGGSNVDLIALGNDYGEINRWLQPILKAAEANPGLARPRIDYEPNAPRLSVDIDRDKAATLGVPAQSIGRVLETMFGSRKVGTYIKSGQEYDVIVQSDLEKRRTIDDLNTLYVRSGSGQLVPLASVVTTKVRGDTPDRPRVDRLRAITLTMQLNPGYTVADAVKFLQDESAKQTSGGVTVAWGGQARDYLEASGGVAIAFGLALLLVFLVLAAQFESWIHPAVIMLTVPLAALGGLFGLLITGSTINTYSQIGLVILIGIAAKNGILIVEFANQMRDEGKSIRDAVIEAASLRLRPIVMTSISAAFGALPLILWSGAGAESRKTIGVVIFFGVLVSTMLTLFVVPVFYNMLARFTKSPEFTAKQIEAFEEQEEVLKKAAE
ncbi:MAG: multidrug transporter AcrB [Caulobacter sp.]|nr:multidrug transporter AcrB [Caulobacter sp.]